MKAGTRVIAILGKEGDTVKLLGRGEFVGFEIPDASATGLLAEICRGQRRTNPKIKLDNGKIVWGCECWWGPEGGDMEKMLKEGQVVEVDIDEARGRARGTPPGGRSFIPVPSLN